MSVDDAAYQRAGPRLYVPPDLSDTLNLIIYERQKREEREKQYRRLPAYAPEPRQPEPEKPERGVTIIQMYS